MPEAKPSPLTYSAEREAKWRAYTDWQIAVELFAELDATRAALCQKEEQLGQWLALGAETPHAFSTVVDAVIERNLAGLRDIKKLATELAAERDSLRDQLERTQAVNGRLAKCLNEIIERLRSISDFDFTESPLLLEADNALAEAAKL